MRMTITAEDLLKGKVLPKGWYPCKVTKIEEKTDSEGAGLDVLHMSVLSPAEFKGCILYNNISEKGPGFVVSTGLAKSIDLDLKPGVSWSNQIFLNKTIDVFSQPGMYNGKPKNDVQAFRKHEGGDSSGSTVPVGQAPVVRQ